MAQWVSAFDQGDGANKDLLGGKVPSPGVAGNLTKVHLGATGQGKGGPPPSQQESKLNYWSADEEYLRVLTGTDV